MRTSAVFFASVLSLGALLPIACTQDFGIFEPSGSSSSGGGAGGGSAVTTSSVSSTSSGMGGAPQCQPGDACSDQNPCTTDSCDTAAGKCAHVNVPDGPSADGMDTPKDCMAPACINGALTQVPNNSDIPDDGNLCTSDTCTDGTPSNPDLPAMTSCGTKLYCNGTGDCVGCVTDGQCTDPGACKYAKCEGGQCNTKTSTAGTTCNNGQKVCDDGGNCVTCISDASCNGNKICINTNCLTSCNTGVKDGKESDVDCGGQCTKCALGKVCGSNSDCTSNICTGNVCVAPGPTCTDVIKNGMETDVDCGGPVCATKCANGKMCVAGTDCVSTVCTGNVCVAPAPTCTDMIKNGMETDVDCGGPVCATKCGSGKACSASTDCLVGTCVMSVCTP